MAYLRSLKNQDILNSNNYIEYKKDKTLFITAKSNYTNNQFLKNESGCLIATNSYANRLNINKGHNLVKSECNFTPNSLKPAIIGRINEANFIKSNLPSNDSENNYIIHSNTQGAEAAKFTPERISSTFYTNLDNQIGPYDPIAPPWNGRPNNGFTEWDSSGVMIDPNRIFVNKKQCPPLIYSKKPDGNNFYNLNSQNGNPFQYTQLVKNNTKLTNFQFGNISL